jgi:hypothetical protein
MLAVNSPVGTRFGRLRPLFDGAVAFRQSLKGGTAEPPYIAFALARGRNYSPSHDLINEGRLTAVVQCLARGIEGLAHGFGGGIVKNTARNEWKYGRHANTLLCANVAPFRTD